MTTTGDVQRRAQEIADDLLGTCDSAPEEVMEVEPLAEALDDLVMCCWSCGWWVESYEIDDDGDCEDCGHDKED